MIAIPHEENLQLGYYMVGNTIHHSKTTALIDGTAKNIHPEWRFNNEIFDGFDWSIDPQESLSELYLQRCQQLREKYDYLMLMYSAGSDSQLILDTFLKNGLRIDEIITIHPYSLEKVIPANYNDYADPLNIMAEWDLNMRPKLDWISKNYPEIKITIYDWAVNIDKVKIKDDYVMDRNHNISAFFEQRYDWTTIPSVVDKLAKHDRVGVIIGVDKPRVCFHQGAYRLYFLDLLTSSIGPQVLASKKKHECKTEFFYWSPECCKLIAKQAHALVKYFESNKSFKKFINWPIANPQFRTWYDVSVRAIIYPEMDLDFFQAHKPFEMVFGFDAVLFNIEGMKEKLVNTQKNNVNQLQKIIDKKFWQTSANGIPVLVGFTSGMYPIKFAD